MNETHGTFETLQCCVDSCVNWCVLFVLLGLLSWCRGLSPSYACCMQVFLRFHPVYSLQSTARNIMYKLLKKSSFCSFQALHTKASILLICSYCKTRDALIPNILGLDLFPMSEFYQSLLILIIIGSDSDAWSLTVSAYFSARTPLENKWLHKG